MSETLSCSWTTIHSIIVILSSPARPRCSLNNTPPTPVVAPLAAPSWQTVPDPPSNLVAIARSCNMERLCDEVLQLIFNELADPGPFTFVSRRFYRFSQDPYVRAHYFLNHYGHVEAMFYAMGRGKVLTERVLDILLASGAHLSRYLIQVASHHYFHTQSHFIKSPWVRRVPLQVIAHFLRLAQAKYGEIPWGKGDDDGSVFTVFLKESRLPPQMKSVTWETIKTLMAAYNFIPFSSRDPIMSQLPLALAIEPRLLPYAVANGFSLDYKYRDFVFRKMFERPSPSSDTRAEDIADNVRELCKLDPAMFVTRTVAAEVCMEAKSNEPGFTALKQLNRTGDLRFDLSILVEDLLRSFLSTRSICSALTGEVLLHLFKEFPSTNVAVRLVVLVLVFLAADNHHMSTVAIRAKLESLALLPVTKKDMVNVLINPFVERYNYVLDFARSEVTMKDGTKGMSAAQVDSFVEEVGMQCLEIACKGKLLNRLHKGFPRLKDTLAKLIVQKYAIDMDDLPCWEDDPVYHLHAKLCQDLIRYGVGDVYTPESLQPEDTDVGNVSDDGKQIEAEALPEQVGEPTIDYERLPELGEITQESLTSMIRQDEITPTRSRRRILYSYGQPDSVSRLRYPPDYLLVGKWAKSVFDAKSSVMAVFMTHAVINDNCTMIHHYALPHDGSYSFSNGFTQQVPITFKHFQLLAHLGQSPNAYLWHSVESGAQFYMDENDYIPTSDPAGNGSVKRKVKSESPQCTVVPPSVPSPPSPSTSTSGVRGKKRPRRSAAVSVRSYAVPGSDDEAIAEDSVIDDLEEDKKTPKESNLQLWIKHLSQLLKVETRKFNELKKRIEKSAGPESKVRIHKNDFLKSLATNLRNLRKLELNDRLKYNYLGVGMNDYSDDEDDRDYTSRRTKKRKTTIIPARFP